MPRHYAPAFFLFVGWVWLAVTLYVQGFKDGARTMLDILGK
jgi:hypothetical protein